MYSYRPPHMAGKKQDDQLEHTFSSYVRIQDVALKTCQRRWKIGRSGERGSGISVLAARHDDEDDDKKPLAVVYSSQTNGPTRFLLQLWVNNLTDLGLYFWYSFLFRTGNSLKGKHNKSYFWESVKIWCMIIPW